MTPNTTGLPPEVTITPACLLPKVKGKKLSKAKRALAHSHCELGKVKRKKSTRKAGTVISQKPKPGRILLGEKVALTVSKG